MLPSVVGIVVLWRWSGPGSVEQNPPTAEEVVAKARQVLGRLLPERKPRLVRLPPVPNRHVGAHRRLPRYAPTPTMYAPVAPVPPDSPWPLPQPRVPLAAEQWSVARIRAREDADHLSYYGGPRRPAY
ncbi:hypothetical protein [Crossiella equi]|nr:hypothetical protein [Crossiella equi]